ncbi:MAG: DUF2018 family protein [Sulfurimonas sp.]|nr:DUF2018 family protein [Sulfurimonas sp.]
MGKFDALFEDEDDIFAGTPESKYWDISAQLSEDLLKDEFDGIVARLAAMEAMLAENHDYDDLDATIRNFQATNFTKMAELKKSVYMELAGQLIYRVAE